VIVITKALKDVMCLSMFGIPAIAPMSETSVVSDSVLEDLKESFQHVYALYDRDKVGKIALLNLRSRGVEPLMMPKGTTKDFSDLCKIDMKTAMWLVDQFKEQLEIL
jgi:DNA primase